MNLAFQDPLVFVRGGVTQRTKLVIQGTNALASAAIDKGDSQGKRVLMRKVSKPSPSSSGSGVIKVTEAEQEWLKWGMPEGKQ